MKCGNRERKSNGEKEEEKGTRKENVILIYMMKIYDGDIREVREKERENPSSIVYSYPSIHGIQSMDWRLDTLTIGCDTSFSFHSIEFAFNSNLTYSIPNTP